MEIVVGNKGTGSNPLELSSFLVSTVVGIGSSNILDPAVFVQLSFEGSE